MRTTIRIDDDLLLQAKRFALKHNCSLTKLFEEALKDKLLAEKSIKKERRTIRLPKDGTGGLLQGVNLDSGKELLAIMESSDVAI